MDAAVHPAPATIVPFLSNVAPSLSSSTYRMTHYYHDRRCAPNDASHSSPPWSSPSLNRERAERIVVVGRRGHAPPPVGGGQDGGGG